MKKYFTEAQTNIATFIGGPMAGGLLIYKNFLKLERKKEAQVALSVTFLLTISMAVFAFNIPEEIFDKIPVTVFSSFYTIISAIVFRRFLRAELKQKNEEGAGKSSHWLAAGFTLGGLIINLIILYAVAFNQAPFKGEKLSFGVQSNEVYYDKGNTTLEEIQYVATTLRAYGYFNDEYQNAVRVERKEEVFVLTLPISKDVWDNEDIRTFLGSLRISLEKSLKSKVKVLGEDYKLSGDVIYKSF